jgi:predicted permease
MVLWVELRGALRALLRDRAYTSIALLTLGFGIAANTVIFSIVDGVLLRPLNYREPERLVAVNEVITELAGQYPRLPVAVRHYLEWKEKARSFDQIGLIDANEFVLTGHGEPEQLVAAVVTPSLLPMLGVRMQAGRGFSDAEAQPGHDDVVLITDGLWRRRFNGDRGVVGRAVTLDGKPRTVIGVLPPSFGLPKSEPGQLATVPTKAEVFAPFTIRLDRLEWFGPFNYTAIARLKPGVSVQQAVAELDALQAGIARHIPDKVHLTALVRPLATVVTGASRTPLLILFGAVGAVLLVVCVNIANLALVRGVARMREVGIRRALGASRIQLIRSVVAESVLLGAAGGVLGVGLAWAGLRVLLTSAPVDLPRLDEVQLDARVLAFASGLSILAGLLFGLLPAWRAAETDPQQTLRDGTRSATEGRRGRLTRQSLVGLEAAVSTVLLAVAGLLLVSFANVLRDDTGIEAGQQVTARLTLPPTTPEVRQTFYRDVLAALEQVPGVRHAAIVSRLPLEGESWVDLVQKEGETRPLIELPPVNYRFCSPEYFRAVGIALVSGRAFTDADRNRRLAVISEATARAVWPNEDPVGKRFTRGDPKAPPTEVIGVVRDVSVGLAKKPVATAFIPYWDTNESLAMAVVLRTTGSPMAVAGSIRQVVWRVNPDTVVSAVRTMEQVASDSVAGRRFQVLLTALFAASALLLACIGIYGVVSWSVARRRGEIGVRMALGAASSDVRRMVVREGMRPVLLGIAAGVASALAVGRVLSGLLFDVSPRDPMTLAAVAMTLVAVAALACYVPARRATLDDPIRVLRCDG